MKEAVLANVDSQKPVKKQMDSSGDYNMNIKKENHSIQVDLRQEFDPPGVDCIYITVENPIQVELKQEFDAPGDDYVDIKENEYLIIVELKQELNTTGNDNIGINLEHPIKV